MSFKSLLAPVLAFTLSATPALEAKANTPQSSVNSTVPDKKPKLGETVVVNSQDELRALIEQHLPYGEVWLVCSKRKEAERIFDAVKAVTNDGVTVITAPIDALKFAGDAGAERQGTSSVLIYANGNSATPLSAFSTDQATNATIGPLLEDRHARARIVKDELKNDL